MRLLGNDLDHVELELDGGLSAEHGHGNHDLVLVDVEQNAVNVIVSMFGRETSVEFELDMIEVVSQ